MDHAVIPAPTRFEAGTGPGFAFRPGTVVAYADTRIAPVAGRFCAQVARRTGLRLVQGPRAPGEPSVTIELAAGGERAGLPAAAGLSPASPTRPGAPGRSPAGPAHRARLAARHGRLWTQDGLTWFRASTVDWT